MKKLFIIVVLKFAVFQLFSQTDTTDKHSLIPGQEGFAFEFFSGYGIFNGTLQDNYSNSVPLGVAVDLCIKKFEIYLRGYAGFNKTKVDLDYSTGAYEKRSPTRVFLPEVSLGYVVLDRDRYKLSPYAGIGVMHISPPSINTDKISGLKEISYSSFTCNFGANFDINFVVWKV